MKISEMTNEQASEALIRLSVPFGNICDDEKVVDMLNRYKNMDEMSMLQTVGKVLPELAAFAFKEHKHDLYEIVGALTEQSAEKVAKMKFVDTIKVLRESYDDVLKDFFTSSARQTRKAAEK